MYSMQDWHMVLRFKKERKKEGIKTERKKSMFDEGKAKTIK